MSIDQVTEIGRELLYVCLLLVLPVMLASVLVGLLVSVLQTMTSIQEQTLSIVARLVAIGLVLIIAHVWRCTRYTAEKVHDVHLSMDHLQQTSQSLAATHASVVWPRL